MAIWANSKRQLSTILRTHPHDCSTNEGRAKERLRRAAWASVAMGGARATGFVTALISVPLTLHYLGPERYGMWMTMSAFLAMAGFADLGLGNGLMTLVSQANGLNDRAMARRGVSNAFFMLCGIGAIVFSAFVLLSPWISWPSLFNVRTAMAANEAAPGMAAMVLCFVLAMPLSVVRQAQVGYQRGFESGLWQAAGGLLGLGLVLVAVHLEAGLPWLVLGMSGGPVLASAVNFAVYFFLREKQIAPKWTDFGWHGAKELISIGLLFFVLQVSMAFAYASDNVVAAHALGAAAVAQLAVPARLFGIIQSVVGMLTMPLWPAYGEALARGDTSWAINALGRSVRIAFAISAVSGVCLVLFGQSILGAWVGPSVAVPVMLIAALGIWTVLASCGSAVAMFLNGARIVREQVVIATVFTVVAVVLKIAGAGVLGLTGIVLGTSAAYVFTTLIPYRLLIVRRFLSESS